MKFLLNDKQQGWIKELEGCAVYAKQNFVGNVEFEEEEEVVRN